MDNLSMAPWLTVEVAISIAIFIATMAGVLVAYRELKPGLRLQSAQCRHKVRYTRLGKREEIAGTEVVVDFEIGNTGGTTSVHAVEIRCKPLEHVYRTTEKVQAKSAITIEKGKEVSFTHQFYIPRRGVFESPFDCKFFLHHTHGKKKVEAKSTLREK